MAKYNYSHQSYNKETVARAVGRDLDISTKQCIEICNFLRGMNILRAKTVLNGVMELKTAIPFKRFTNGVGHRAGDMASGRYPMNAAKEILTIIENAETNAQQKGLNTSRMALVHLSTQKASRPMHAGRKRGRSMKRSHIEVTLGEAPEKEDKKKARREGSKSQSNATKKKEESK